MMNDTSRTIRPYQAEDIEPVIDVWQRANALAHPFLSEDFVAGVHRAMRDIYLPNAETYLLEVGGNVVGFIALIGNEIGGLSSIRRCTAAATARRWWTMQSPSRPPDRRGLPRQRSRSALL